MKPIPGCAGYFADENGDIFSFWGTGPRARFDMNREPKKIRPSLRSKGKYFGCSLRSDNGEYRQNSVHVFVAESFHGPRPSPRHQASHLNGNSFDNRPENLTWEPIEDNHARKILHQTDDCGHRNSRAKLSEVKVKCLKLMILNGKHTRQQLGDIFGVGRMTVTKVATGDRYAR